jgi:hypothetical protein
LICCLAFALVAQGRAWADSPRACADAYEKAQEERKAGRITAAIGYLTKCAAQDCPSFVRKDCLQWMTDAERAQPSVVFAVRRDGVELTSVEIVVDGRLLTNLIDGKAIALDPGAHVFTFRAPDGVSTERSRIIREGERNRLIEVELPGSLPVEVPGPLVRTPAQVAEMPRQDLAPVNPTRSWLPYGLAGVGVLGVSGFAVFGLWGHSQKNHLEDTCSPFCQSSQVDEVRTKYILADACLAVGLVSLGAAAYYFLRDREDAAKVSGVPSTASLLPTLSPGRGAVDLAIRF